MEKRNLFDTGLARRYCMNYGTVVGVMCSISFLCAVFSFHHVTLGLLGNILGVLAFVKAGRQIRNFRQQVADVSFGRACWMAVSIYFYAILLTGAVQYVYFAYFDHGMLMEQMQKMLDMPEFRQLLTQMAQGEDAENVMNEALSVFLSPARATMQLMWMNCFMSLLLTVPTALIGITGKGVKDEG